ncbi:MAG: thiamine-phosphate kinase [Rhodospirillaceae bacterium]|nr:thiamine-phosphate kinase [Rhodospirillaceae bacterium]
MIARYFAPLAAKFPGALNLKDDAALIAVSPGRELAVTTDAIVAGVHFLPDDPPDLIARKLLRVNLSDLAAMGATPLAYLLIAAFPKNTPEDWIAAFTEGLAADQAAFRIDLCGGDTVATTGPLTLAATALGAIDAGKALRRSTAGEGDIVYVSGSIGDAVLGLAVLRGSLPGLGTGARDWAVGRYRLPQPRVELGRRLVGLATSAIDVSDGLVADLGHVCVASGVGAVIEVDSVPLSPACREALVLGGIARDDLISGGDDYELLFTLPAARVEALAAVARETGLILTPIGRIVAGSGVSVVDAGGRDATPRTSGFRHF